jgi:hypothetical protein
MPRFHFPIVDGTTLHDPVGIDLKNASEAKALAKSIAGQLRAVAPDTHRSVVAVDDDGNEIHKVPVQGDGD